ncbi:MAG TPA: cupin domain-containing protein [Xanthobacteraceae bacterium]|nr:cupin domain-containing protein [Xanthobacteraceae bacterium]
MLRGKLAAKVMTMASCAVGLLLLSQPTHPAEQTLVVKPLAEKKIDQLPSGPLFWRIENFPTMAQAQAAAGPTSLAAESEGKVWLFTLGATGGASPGGTKVAEIGPLPSVVAKNTKPPAHYLLRINEASGPPDSRTSVHTHPGSETFYVLAGETSQRTPHGVIHVGAGQSAVGRGPDTPMQVWSSGKTELHSLVMFVVDAGRPFSSPAEFHASDDAK